MKFVKGMDLSTFLELEKCGARYYVDGTEMDILDIMKKYDVDTIRIRLWNDPWSENGESYGAGENDLKTTLAIAKKVTDAGLGVLLNFHYSDFWADPGKQIKPKAWKDYSVEQLEQPVRQISPIYRSFLPKRKHWRRSLRNGWSVGWRSRDVPALRGCVPNRLQC